MRKPQVAIYQPNDSTVTISLVCIFDNYEELIAGRSWSGIGTLTMVAYIGAASTDPISGVKIDYTDELVERRLILVDNDPKMLYEIVEISKEYNETNGKGKITVRGKEAKWMTNRRKILPPVDTSYYTDNGNPDAVIKDLICSQMGTTCLDTKRKFPLLSIEATAGLLGTYVLTARFERLDEIVTRISEETGIGWWFELGTNTYQLKCAVGTDRTAEIRINPKLGTAKQGSINYSDIEYKNFCYTEGQSVITAQYSGASEPTGSSRFEEFESATDLSNILDVKAQGDQVLAAKAITKTITAKYTDTTSYVFERDFYLGDIVSIDFFGESAEGQIVAYQKTWNSRGYDLSFTFDKPYAEFPLSARRRLDKLNSIVNRMSGLSAVGLDDMAIGDIKIAAYATPDAGYLNCDGSAVSRTTYAALFAKLGTTWGSGDGSTTFNIPDGRAAAFAGVGTSTGYTQNETITLGTKYNDQIHDHGHEWGYGEERNFSTSPGTYTRLVFGSGGGSNSLEVSTGIVKDATAINSNGTPRTGNVTRGKRIGVYYHIRAL